MKSPLRPPHVFSLVLVITLAGCTPAPNPEIGQFEEIPCPVALPDEAATALDLTCGYVSVPVRHKEPHGPVLKIAVAQFKSTNPEAASDPLVLNNGGPGDSNFESLIPVLASPVGAAILAKRDVVLIELRGLLHSENNLVCDEVFEAQDAMAGQDVKGPEANELLEAAMRKSHARFVDEGIDVAAYNNTETADDIVFIMSGLGYDQFNLFGSSAGTMVAQRVMRNHPDRLRAVVMNAAVPNGSILFREMLVIAAESLEQYFRSCEADEACSAAYPNMEDRFFEMLHELNANPVPLTVTIGATENPTTLLLNGDKISSWTFSSMYYNTQIIRTLDRLTKGDFSEIQQSPNIFFPMPRFSYALGYTVTLSDLPDFRANTIASNPKYQPFIDGMGLFFSPKLMEATRDLWSDGYTAVGDLVPIESDIPTLVMNGKLDHVIPSEDVVELFSSMPNAHINIFEGVAHAPVDVGECGLMMLMTFIDDPSAAPDNSCMAAYSQTFALPD